MSRSGPPDGGLEYPFVNPTPDIAGKLTDFHLAYDGDNAVLPLRLARLEGIGQYWEANSSTSRESNTSTFGRPELLVVDGANNVILDTKSVPSHTTRVWGSYVIHEWRGDNVFCMAAAPPASDSDMPERLEPDSAILDERTWYQPKRRVKKLIVDGQEINGKISMLGGYNTVVTPNSTLIGAAGKSISNNVNPFAPSRIYLSAEAGSGAGRYPDCLDENPPIRRINGQTGDPSKNFYFVGKDCVTITQPVQYSNGTATPDEGGIIVSDSCGPCCDCHDYEKVAISMRRLWDEFSDIGHRAELVRDNYKTIRDRMVNAQECIAQKPIRIVAYASKNRVVDINVAMCNNTGSCKYKVRINVNFVHTRRRRGLYDNEEYYATNVETGELQTYSAPPVTEISGVFWPYPELYHDWPFLKPNQLGRLRIRLQFEEFRPGDQLYMEAFSTIAGTYGPDIPNTTIDIRP